MKLADVSIKRPVFATMMIVVLAVFGVVLYTRLSVDMYPDVDFPIVTVTVLYPGADPETMEQQVADPIEEAVNSLSGIRTLRSSSLESVTQVFIEFELDRDLDLAAQDVRERIATVATELPDGAEQPMVQKLDLGAAPIMQLALSGPSDETTLARYAEDELKPALERVNGVGSVTLVGGRTREAHIWLDREAILALGITVSDVVGAIRAQNIDLPAGRIDAGDTELILRTDAQADSAQDLESLTVATHGDRVVRLSDVATVEDGFEEQRSLATVDGQPAIAIVIQKQSGANTVEVADAVEAALPALEARGPPGSRVDVLLDNAKNIEASIETVQFDLLLGAFLAVAIIFLFLRDFRATVISALALPTAVLGTFGFVAIMGFTLNMMTTLALSLSIGILIDDAIVVIENIVRRRTTLGETPMVAASRGVAEIGLAVIAVTLTIVAVFVPVAFMEGMIGQFFYEFGLTVAVAVLLSLFVSFTLTPMLSSRFLEAHEGEARGLSGVVERVLLGIERGYRRLIEWSLRHRIITVGGAVATLVGTLALVPLLGFEFMPQQDQSQFATKLELPAGTSLGRTAEVAAEIASELREVPGVASTFTTVGGGAQEKVNTANIVVTLVPRDQRQFHQTEAMAHVRRMLGSRRGVVSSVEPVQMISTGGRNAQLQLDLRGSSLEELDRVAQRIAERMRAAGGYVDVDTTYRSGKPELRVEVDRQRASDLGVTGAGIATTLRALVAGEVAGQIQRDTERYDIRVQLDADARQSTEAIAAARLRTTSGQLVEVGTVANIVEQTGPSQIDREARQRQVSVVANLEGKVLGDALEEVEAFAAAESGDDTTYAFGGSAKMLEESMKSMLFSLFLAILCVYIILAAQFESFVHPLTIMMSLPFSLIGAFGGLLVMGSSMSIFAMIGLIMLMGLVTKNAILLIEFAIQRRAEGQPIFEAVANAGAVRLRPILMTTAAMIFGMLPVAIGHGDGGEVRAPMGITVIGGLITSTVLTLVVVPVIYTLVDGAIVRVKRLFSRPTAHPAHTEANSAPAE